MKFILISFLVILFCFSFSEELANAARTETPQKDPKGTLYIFTVKSPSPAELKKNLEDHFSEQKEQASLEMIWVEASDPEDAAKKILALTQDQKDKIGGIIQIDFENASTNKNKNSVSIEVYHYPFPPIAEEHIESPEYSFKFGSDSALMAMSLYKNFPKNQEPAEQYFSSIEIKPAEKANPHLPLEILKKSVTVAFAVNPSAIPTKIIADNLFKGIRDYYNDESYHVMGVLSDKVQKRQKPEDIEIRVFPYIYPTKEFSDEEKKTREEEMSKPLKIVKPFPSYLFTIDGLDRITPCNFKVIDTKKDEKDFWYEVDEGSFVTSSMKGVVRTIPNQFPDYIPLENTFKEPAPQSPDFEELDYVIEGASILDGTRNAKRFVADVGISGEKIAAVGNLKNVKRKLTIEGKGLFLCPGFIDIHSHVDWNILDAPDAASHIRQGITTVLGGNCAFSPLGIGAFYLSVEEKGALLNFGLLIGNRPVREAVLGRIKGQPLYADVYKQKELLDLGMEEGAFGMSSGLIYKVSEEAFTWELAELAKQVKPYGGFYASHIRGESSEVIDAVREAIYIGEIAETPVQISHMKVISRRNWGDMKRYLEIMKSARARGLDVTGDQYPWRASGPAAHYRLYRLLTRDAIKRETPEVVLLKDMPAPYEKYSGRLLTELLEGENITPEELIKNLNLTKDSKVYATYLCLGEEDVLLPMKEDFVMVSTDASLVPAENIESGKSKDDHPRKFRTYPEFFGKYVRDKEVCSWELGVYKCTGLPAQRMKLEDRGIVRKGAYADLVLFDPEKIAANTDYRDQTPPPKGIHWVLLNGNPVLKEGELINIRAGKVLRAYGNRKP